MPFGIDTLKNNQLIGNELDKQNDIKVQIRCDSYEYIHSHDKANIFQS